MSMVDSEPSNLFTLRQVARALGITPENLRALEKRGRLPEGCEPELDLLTGTRGWTAEQVERLRAWNDERLGRNAPPEVQDGEQ